MNRVTEHAPSPAVIAGRVASRLSTRFGEWFTDDEIIEVVLDSYRRFTHLDGHAAYPRALTAQFAADRLDARRFTARAADTHRPPSVLFLCAGNAGRSQIAAAVARALGGNRVRVMSAGDAPAPRILPPVVEVLDEIGVPVIGEYPKPTTSDLVAAADTIVLLNCTDEPEVLGGREALHWSIPLAHASGRAGMRRTRDDIAERVAGLLASIGVPPASL